MSSNGAGTLAAPVLKAEENSMAEIGSSGLIAYNGVLAEESNPQLQGDKAVATYREMTRDPVVGGALLAIDNLVRRVEWTFEAPEDQDLGDEGQRWVDHCQSCLGDMSMSWDDTVSSIFTMVPYGWSYHNVVLKQRLGEQPDSDGALPSSDYDDGLIGWRKISLRAQESRLRWELGPHGEIKGMWQQVFLLGQPAVLIPIQNAGLFRTSAHKNNPEGQSVLRSALTPWWAKRRINELEGIGIERDLAGLPVAWVPEEILHPNATPAQKQQAAAFKRMVTNVRRNTMEGTLFPLAYDEHGNKRYDFTLLSSGSRRQIDIDAVIARKNQEIAICLLADFLLLGHEAVGSKALGSSKIDLFSSALETWGNGVADVFNAHITPRLMRANGVAARLSPQLRPGRVQQTDVENFATAMGTLVKSGVVERDDDFENFVRQECGLPPKMEQVTVLPPAGPPTAEQDAAAAQVANQPDAKGAIAA